MKNNEVTQLNNELAEVEARIAAEREEPAVVAELATLTTRIRNGNDMIAHHRRQLDEQSCRIDEMRRTAKALPEIIAARPTSLGRLLCFDQAVNSAALLRCGKYDAATDALEHWVATSAQRIAALEHARRGHEQRVGEIEVEISDLTTRVRSLKAEPDVIEHKRRYGI